LELTFGGSGYDIACANYDAAISYQLTKPFDNTQNQKRHICQVDFCPEFKDCLYFVYLNKKQNSREGIEHYKKNRSQISNEISEINQITSKIIDCKALNEFEALIDHHESIISKILQIEPIKNQIFKDFKGSIKSLGAWGGDFILATSKINPKDYFKSKGFETVIPFEKMVLK
jgi:mevalonate kinase